MPPYVAKLLVGSEGHEMTMCGTAFNGKGGRRADFLRKMN